ncbi:MAG: DUF1772 domain-containing protein [Rhodomicrobiaceae bacterium]
MTYLKILALALTAIILIPSGAHLFELPAKIELERDAYFTVQGIYAGWSLFAAPIFAAILANGALFLAARRRHPLSAWLALGSCVLIAVSLVIFFIWVFPANQATQNWTMQPENWEILRQQWEYGHAVNAIIVFAAFLLTALAASLPERRA